MRWPSDGSPEFQSRWRQWRARMDQRLSGSVAGSINSSPPSAAERWKIRSCSRTYAQLVAESREVVMTHVKTLAGQLAAIIAVGVQRGEFADVDPAMAGRAVFDATARFHNPVHAAEWSDPGIDAAFEGVWSLVVDALRPGR
jgi:Tetracyclin repressor-like, C-terminal domain